MRSNDNGDDMSMMVGTVLSGFEYRAQKKSMITYINSSKKMKRNINIQALQKAINKTQNVGYQNEYFYITYLSRNLKEYRKYYEPLIHKMIKNLKKVCNKLEKS